MDQLQLERSIWIDAPRDRVWQAITDPEHIARWLLPPFLEARIKDDDGTLSVCMAGQEVPLAIVEAVDPLRQLSSRSLPDRVLATSYSLDDEDGGTQVTVRVSGFESLAPDARQDRLAPMGTGWERALANMKAFVDGAELPFPEGYVAAIFGYRREARERFAIERSIWIAAPRERVWQAITDPRRIEQWFSPGTAWQLTALEVGGRLFVPDPDTGAEQYTQVIETVDPPQRLVLRSVPDTSGISHGTIYSLQDEQDGTRLTITNTGYELVPADARWSAMEQNAFGFGMMLENMKAFVEGRSVPYPGGF